MCLPGAERVILGGRDLALERVILSASEEPPQCPSFPCGLKFFSPPSILLFLAPAGYTFRESALPQEFTTILDLRTHLTNCPPHTHLKNAGRLKGLHPCSTKLSYLSFSLSLFSLG